jgi:1-phosphofructokinase
MAGGDHPPISDVTTDATQAPRGDPVGRVGSGMPDTVVIFAPLPIITVTIEDRGGDPDVHVHAGGQGVWQSRMISSLGVPVVLCSALGGETGNV